MGAVGVVDVEERVPQLAAGCDSSALELSPAEGFLLSRIDGSTPWKLLREIGGMSPEEVDMCLESWVAQGLVECTQLAPERTPDKPPDDAASRPHAPRGPRSIDPASLDESLSMEIETQRRILEFELKLDGPYHEILGVDQSADVKTIKRAYFGLSTEFHPDRYFRKDIGAYEKRLDAIFKRILEAYELLSDPTVRAEVEKSMSAAAQSAPPPKPDEPPRELTKLERLRARMPFKLPASLLAERQQRAREFWDVAQRDVVRSRFIEAASAVRLAIAFDPFNEIYREGFGMVQGRAAEMRAEALIAEADAAESQGLGNGVRSKELLRLYEEALLYRPHQPELNERAARAAIDGDELAKALEYAERAVEHRPEVADYHITLASVHRARGNPGHAAKALEQALQLEPQNLTASKQLATLRRA